MSRQLPVSHRAKVFPSSQDLQALNSHPSYPRPIHFPKQEVQESPDMNATIPKEEFAVAAKELLTAYRS